MSHSYDCPSQLSDGSGSLTGFARGSVRRNIDFNSAANERIAACCSLGVHRPPEHRDQPANAASFIAPKFRTELLLFSRTGFEFSCGKISHTKKKVGLCPTWQPATFF